MSKLKPRIKHIPLDFIGEGWEEASIEFRALKWSDVRDFDPEKINNAEAMDRMLGLLSDSFVAGQGVDPDGQTIALSSEDIAEFDLETQATLFQRLSGTSDPNA